jgi:hypothetical protein
MTARAERLPVAHGGAGTAQLRVMALWIAGAGLGWWVTDDWVGAFTIAVLALFWSPILTKKDEPPVFALALSHQWAQVAIGFFYFAMTGRVVPANVEVDRRPMVILGTVCLILVFAGLVAALQLGRRLPKPRLERLPLDLRELVLLYFGATFFESTVQIVAWSFPRITQLIIAATYFRYVVLFILIRRLMHPTPRWLPVGGIVLFEIAIGFTGFFAGFREPLIITLLVMLERTRTLAPATRRAVYGSMGIMLAVTAIVWTAVKPAYRAAYILNPSLTRMEKLQLIATLGSSALENKEEILFSLDHSVARVWQVDFPALAMERVPNIVPHTNGAMLIDAVTRVLQPRLFFPNKPEMISDSDKVRLFAGVWVAGREVNTSFAFGYVAESYVDFGYPMMFLPILGFGVFIGIAAVLLRRVSRHAELAMAVVTVAIWMSLYLFERSWAMIVGFSITLFLSLAVVSYAFERVLANREAAGRRRGLPDGRIARR